MLATHSVIAGDAATITPAPATLTPDGSDPWPGP
jgi:hypothetical protein